MKKQKTEKKQSFFWSLFCGCNEREDQNQKGKNYQKKQNQKSLQQEKNILYENEIVIRKSKPSNEELKQEVVQNFIPISNQTFIKENTHNALYLQNEFNIIQGISKDINQMSISILNPPIQDIQDQRQRIAVRFPATKRFFGIGIGYHEIIKKNNYNLLQVQIQLSEEDKENGEEEPGIDLSCQINGFGGYFMIFDSKKRCSYSTNPISHEIIAEEIFLSNKECFILEYSKQEEAEILLISTIEGIQMQKWQFNSQFDKNKLNLDDDSLHFCVIVNDPLDRVQILGDPEKNDLLTIVKSLSINYEQYQLIKNQFKLLEQSAYKSIEFDYNNDLNQVVVRNNTEKQQEMEGGYVFAFLTPYLPFPRDSPNRIRVGIQVDQLGNGLLFFGIQRLGYAKNNIVQAFNQLSDLKGQNFIIDSNGVSLANKKQVIQNMKNQINMFVLEYDPVQEMLIIFNYDEINQYGVFKELYRTKSQDYFENNDNKYCFVIGGLGDFQATFINCI